MRHRSIEMSYFLLKSAPNGVYLPHLGLNWSIFPRNGVIFHDAWYFVKSLEMPQMGLFCPIWGNYF